MDAYATFLFPTPSALRGAATVIDLGGTMLDFNKSSSGQAADERALRADFTAVAEDLHAAVEEVTAGA